MTSSPTSSSASGHQPSRKERMRPTEYLLLSGGAAVFAALITLMVTRDFTIAVIALGVVFIVTLLTIALLALAMKPDDAELGEIDAQNEGARDPH